MTPQIFVLGNSRSGTTMVARILGLHSQVQDLRELHFIEQMISGAEFASKAPLERERALGLAARLISVIREGYFKGGAGGMFRSEAQALLRADMTAAELFEAVRLSEAARLGKPVPIDQTPRNVFYIREILDAYPDARVICMIRDPRDVLLSQKGKWRRRFLGADIPLFEALRSWANYHPLVTAKIWSAAVRAGDEFAQEPRVLRVRFEDMAGDAEASVRAVCAHCGIAFEAGMLNVARIGSSDRKDETGALGVDASRVGTWQSGLSRAEIGICEAQAGALLERHGYAVSHQRGGLLARVLWGIALPFKMALSLALNVKRVRNLLGWARKRAGL